ncbi:hypothetical protein EVAR_5132_1 [Eumeta japonica]|uniref:Uncharacterized protein n=1 Tax=Eumeta variegata TaxID=151549 RepID=A0A4C1SUI1_EUMVA|nr:hypothetical protein EVAR_5132_1 [Eumeta japonica]
MEGALYLRIASFVGNSERWSSVRRPTLSSTCRTSDHSASSVTSDDRLTLDKVTHTSVRHFVELSLLTDALLYRPYKNLSFVKIM